jgi:hypothetical protein
MRPRDPAGSIGDLVKGTGPPDFGLQPPGMGAAAGTSGHAARRRRADADRVGLAGRAADAALVRARRTATSTSSSLLLR